MKGDVELVRTERRSRLAVAAFCLGLCFPVGYLLTALTTTDGTAPGRFDDLLCSAQSLGELLWALGFLLTPLAFAVGIVALVRIRRSAGRLTGTWFAVVAIASILTLGAQVGVMGYEATFDGRTNACLGSIKELGMAMQEYAEAHGGRFPPAEGWCHAISPYLKDKSALRCPEVKGKEPTFAMNPALAGRSVKSITDSMSTVLLFESVPGSSLAGGPELLPLKPRHGSYSVVMADRSVRACSAREILQLSVWGKAARFGR